MKMDGKFLEESSFFINKDRDSTFDGVNRDVHDLFEIYYMVDGECEYYIGGRIYEVISGDVILIPAGVLHENSYRCQKHTRIAIHFSNQYIPTAVLPFIKSGTILYRNSETAPAIHNLTEAMYKEFKNGDDFSDEIIKNYMNLLFLVIARNRKYYEGVKTLSEDVETAKKYIHENYSSEITLKGTAEMIGISAEYLSRMFSAETGFGFCEYVNLVRLDSARMLLRSKNKSVAEVAYECGFNDSNYFSVKFKKMYGISPKDYKKSCPVKKT